jgi:hypothetical protein
MGGRESAARSVVLTIAICLFCRFDLALAQEVMNPVILDDQPAPPKAQSESLPSDQGSRYRPTKPEARTPQPRRTPTAIEYVGYYGCDQQGVAALQLRITDSDGGGVQTAVFRFGPLPLNPNIATGEFLMAGQVDLESGMLSLYPVRWIDRPPGYVMVGLVGTSTDHGYDFEGTVTGVPGCGSFSVSRSR